MMADGMPEHQYFPEEFYEHEFHEEDHGMFPGASAAGSVRVRG
jgi:hypothetical protein